MIVSHELRTIFVKSRKVGGTSVEIALSSLCGPDDIISPVTEEDERLRQELAYKGPQNHLRPLSEFTLRDVCHWARRRQRPLRFYNHMPAAAIRDSVGRDVWSDYLTFTVERNPWDRAVSMYFWRASRLDASSVPSFSAWLRQQKILSNFPLYAENGKLLVDHVLRYERLEEELAELCSSIGLRLPALPQAKSGIRPSRDWRSLYSPEDVEWVARACAPEIGLMGYTFE